MTVIGVVGNVHVDALDEPPTLDNYVPMPRAHPRPPPRRAQRSRSPPRCAPLRAEALAIDPDQPISKSTCWRIGAAVVRRPALPDAP